VSIRKIFALGLGLLVCGFSNRAIYGQTTPSTSDGIYTSAQATRGDALYGQDCALCHGKDLKGTGEVPPLSGGDFTGQWVGQTVADLFNMIQTTMPADQPGKLTRQQAADVLAFILSSNKFPAGNTELPTDEDSQKKIRIAPVPPKS
jgi:S-disulfanyl-L-cysteine oxidoreductase SoxD